METNDSPRRVLVNARTFHLRPFRAALPSPLADSVVRRLPLGKLVGSQQSAVSRQELLLAYWVAAERNRLLWRWVRRLLWIVLVETVVLVGLAVGSVLGRS